MFEMFIIKQKLKKVRFILELLDPHRFRNVREAISCNFVLLPSNMHLVAPIHDEKTVLKNSLVANFGRWYLWATDRTETTVEVVALEVARPRSMVVVVTLIIIKYYQ